MSKKSKARKKRKMLQKKEEVRKTQEENVTEEIVENAVNERVDLVEDNNVEEESEFFLEGKSIDEIIEEETKEYRGKNYAAVIILLLGALLGSLFVDVAQLLSKKGYSVKALREASIFRLENKTWVAYEEPIVNLTVLGVSDEELATCPTCKPPVEVMDLFGKVMPTLVTREVDINSEEGKKMVEKNNIKVLPALIFSKDLEKTEFYNGEAKILFSEIKDVDNYLLSLAGLGLPIGKYIELPKINAEDPRIGNEEAPIKIILFSEHQCPFCAKFFKDIVAITKKFENKVELIYKDLPLEFHPQAMNAAIAGECANDQEKFWEMSTKLYATQKQWGELDDDKAKAFFKRQAINLKLNIEDFGVCLDEGQHKEDIEKSKKQAEEFGISGTPSMFIGDEFIGGVVPVKQLEEIIQEKIDKIEGVKKDDGSEDEKQEEKKDEKK